MDRWRYDAFKWIPKDLRSDQLPIVSIVTSPQHPVIRHLTVNILLERNRIQHALLVDMLWEGELNQDAMHIGISIELRDDLCKMGSRTLV